MDNSCQLRQRYHVKSTHCIQLNEQVMRLFDTISPLYDIVDRAAITLQIDIACTVQKHS